MIHWGWVLVIAFVMFHLGFFVAALFAVSRADDEDDERRVKVTSKERS